jgi:hypothetical protein
MTTVVNKRTDSYDTYIGRGSIFGNPFEIGRDGTRKQVIERYRQWFEFLLNDKVFLNELYKLRDKKLGCFCAPLQCHGEIIADWVNRCFYQDDFDKAEEYEQAMQFLEAAHTCCESPVIQAKQAPFTLPQDPDVL